MDIDGKWHVIQSNVFLEEGVHTAPDHKITFIKKLHFNVHEAFLKMRISGD
jgi:hypothetical protein